MGRRLCIVSPFPPNISGIGQYGWHVTNGLARSGAFDEITVLADRPGDDDKAFDAVEPSVRVEHIWRRDHPTTAAGLLRTLRRLRPDAVWFNVGMTMFGRSRAANLAGLTVPMLARRSGMRVVVTLHEMVDAARLRQLGLSDGALTRLGGRVVTRLLLEATETCVTLGRYADVLRSRYGRQRVHHVPHGALGEVGFLPAPRGGLPHESLCFTSFAPHRGIPEVIEALRQVRGSVPDATLTVAGADHPRYRGYGASLVEQHREEAGLRWTHRRSAPALTERFAEASLVVRPYLATTGASSVVNRAAASGRPIVATDLPDLRSTAEDAGLLVEWVPPGRPDELAAAMANLLASRPRRAAIAEHNLRSMRDHTLARTVDRYGQLLSGIPAPRSA